MDIDAETVQMYIETGNRRAGATCGPGRGNRILCLKSDIDSHAETKNIEREAFAACADSFDLQHERVSGVRTRTLQQSKASPQLTSLNRPEDEHFGFGMQAPSTTLLRNRLHADVEMHFVRAGLNRRPAAQLTRSQTPVDRLSFWPEAHTLALQTPPVSVLRSGLQRLRSMQSPVARSYKAARSPVGFSGWVGCPSCDVLTRIWVERQIFGRHTPP